MRKLVAFIISVIIYTFLILLFMRTFNQILLPNQTQNQTIIKVDIHDFPDQKPTLEFNKNLLTNKKKKIEINKKVKEEIKTTQQKKAHINKDIQKQRPSKETKKIQEKFKPETEVEEMLYIPNPIVKKGVKEKSSDSFSDMEANSLPKSKRYVQKSPKIAKLYGKRFDTFTLSQQDYIIKNLDDIHRITQNRLTQRGYPSGALAAQTGQEGVNIVSFYLHPNGDITDLRLEKYVGYSALDDNTLETIKSAYKDYPYPKETTQVIFYVEYSIFGY